MEQTISTQVRYRRGDPSPVNAGLVFFRYSRGREIWVTSESLVSKGKAARVLDKKWKSTPAGRLYMRDYFRVYNHTPKQKSYHASYYKRPDIKERTHDARLEAVKRFAKTPKGRAIQKRTREKHKDKIRIWTREYQRNKRSTDPTTRIAHCCRNRIRMALIEAGVRKTGRTAQMLGCSFEFFRGWIQAQFTEGMSFSNYGNKKSQWNIDHIIPISRFNLEIESERNRAFHYTNCQPKWSHENRAKSDFIEHEGKQVRAREIRNIIPFQQVA